VHLIVRSVSSAATVPPFLIFYKEIGIMLFSQSTFASPVPINTSIIENKSYKTINAAPLRALCDVLHFSFKNKNSAITF